MRNHQLPGRSVVMSAEAMAATSQPQATEAAIRILREGGNAIDAAITASAVLAVVEPYSTSIGGDCFLLYHESSSGRLHALNGSGRAPAAVTADIVRARGFDQVPEHDILGAREVGMHTVWMNSQGEEWPGGRRADREIDNLRQLPAAIASIAGAIE